MKKYEKPVVAKKGLINQVAADPEPKLVYSGYLQNLG